MENKQNNYDLEERTYQFARDVRNFVKLAFKTISGIEDSKQLIRSSGSVAANYIEANESLSKKDFAMRIKICRKEAKESILWLRLLESPDNNHETTRRKLVQEATELMKIMSAIMHKCD